VLVPFPFSDLSGAKLRPAVVVAHAGRDDWILCQVTSNPYGDPLAITLVDTGFRTGSLRMTSYVRPGKLFTANRALMREEVGNLTIDVMSTIVDAIVGILRTGTEP
jgi:mRNA interferase MazF